MKIIIEHEDATASCVGRIAAPIFSGTQSVLNGIMLQKQTLDRWCWAAIGVALAGYYHTLLLEQHQLASRVLEFDCAGFNDDEAVRERCNINFSLEKVLTSVHCFSHWSLGKPGFERMCYEINCGRPVCCRINWYKGDAHYILINGYDTLGEIIFIEDSLHGSSAIKYDAFPARYREQGGVWTETYWTKKEPFFS